MFSCNYECTVRSVTITSHLHSTGKETAACVFLYRLHVHREIFNSVLYNSVSQLPGPGINYTGPREVLLELVILVS